MPFGALRPQTSLPKLKLNNASETSLGAPAEDTVPRFWGVPLKYVSCVSYFPLLSNSELKHHLVLSL